MKSKNKRLIRRASCTCSLLIVLLSQAQTSFSLDADKDNISDFIEAGGPISSGIKTLSDLDSDGDGLDDLFDVDITGGNDSNGDGIDDLFILLDSDNDGIVDLLDIDSDNDKIPDVIETSTDTDFDGIANYLDPDSNNNGQLDTLESGVLNADVDADGIDDFFDADFDGLEGIDAGKVDANDDGISDGFFNDSNDNNQADYQELDVDQDGIPAPLENGASGNDIDNDGIDDAFDADDDSIPGTDSANTDINSDGILDKALLDADFDNDGLLNSADTDSDGDSITDFIEAGSLGRDYDKDGIDDLFDANSDGDDTPDLGKIDHNSDGIHDLFKGINTDENNTRSDAQPDYLDRDSDNDGIPDVLETSNDFDDDGIPNYQDDDSDADGLSDFIESRSSGNDFDQDGIDDALDADADGGGRVDVGKADENKDGINDKAILDYDESGNDDYLEKDIADTNLQNNKLPIKDSDQDGIPDRIEQNSTGNDKDHDGIDDAFDADQDGIKGIDDGKTDENRDGLDDHAAANGLNLDSDADGLANYLDTDSDNDGILDSIEANVTGEDFDNDGIDDTFDANSDDDSAIDYGKVDENDDGVDDSKGIDTDGDSIADYIDRDSDSDGLPDAIEGIANGVPVDSDRDGIPNYRDTDSDNDGQSDTSELLSTLQLAINNSGLDLSKLFFDSIETIIAADTDNDGISDLFDADIDGGGGVDRNKEDQNNDGINDKILFALGIKLSKNADNSSGFDTPVQTSALDSDANGIADYLELPGNARNANGDADNDGISNIIECLTPETIKASANNLFSPINCLDSDDDGIIDLLDVDSDNDGLLDRLEKGPSAILGTTPWDTDGDGIFNFRDLDSDGDALIDEAEIVDTNEDGKLDDDDNDGIPNVVDAENNGQESNDRDLVPDHLECSAYPNCPDSDNDGQPDYSDDDSDNDGIPDRLELFALLDSNNNGIADWYDGEQINTVLPDFDNDGLANHQDPDSDNDEISDTQESAALAIDSDNDGIDDAYDVDITFGKDINHDGYDDSKLVYIQNNGDENSDDKDGDGIPDYLDLGADSDNDGQSDAVECPSFPDCFKQDSDGDKVANFIDPETMQEVNGETEGLGGSSTIQFSLLLLIAIFYRRKQTSYRKQKIQLSARYVILLISLLSTNSQAIESDFYIGSGITYGKHEIKIDNARVGSANEYNTGKKIYLGLAADNNFRYELSYSDFGNAQLTSTMNSVLNQNSNSGEINSEADVATNMIDFSAYYQINTDFISPYIKLGVARLNRKSDSDDFKLSNQQEVKPLYGLGIDVALDDNWHLRNQIDFINSKDNYWLGLSLEYRFSNNEKYLRHRELKSMLTPLVTINSINVPIEKKSNQLVKNSETLSSEITRNERCNDLKSYLQVVAFRLRSIEIESYAKARLLDLTHLLKTPRYENIKLHIKGYSERIGQPSYSLDISTQRSEAVKQYLIEYGVNANNLLSQGYGEAAGSIIGVMIQCASF